MATSFALWSISGWSAIRELMTPRAFLSTNPPTRRHYFRFDPPAMNGKRNGASNLP